MRHVPGTIGFALCVVAMCLGCFGVFALNSISAGLLGAGAGMGLAGHALARAIMSLADRPQPTPVFHVSANRVI
jgi:hypothetical protein